MSGGPVYFTDAAGLERPEILRRLAFADGRLLMLDEPGQVTPDTLMLDVALEPVPLKVFGHIARNGVAASMVAAFNVNKTARNVTGALSAGDVASAQGVAATGQKFAVYQRSRERVALLAGREAALPFTLDNFGYDLFTLVPVEQGVAVFGLLDKYIGPAAIVSQKIERAQCVLRLREAGDFGAYLERPPVRVELDGRALPPSAYNYRQGLLRIPRASFGDRAGEHELRLSLAARAR